MSISRIRKAQTQMEFDDLVDGYVTIGYKIKDMGEKTTVVKKKQYGSLIGHVILFLLTVWWTGGLANLVYFLYEYLTGEEVEIKLVGE